MNDPPPVNDQDIYAMMDRAGWITSNMYDSRRPLPRIVLESRQAMLAEIKAYIFRRDNQVNKETSNGITQPKINRPDSPGPGPAPKNRR